jgi:hypothetical protein
MLLTKLDSQSDFIHLPDTIEQIPDKYFQSHPNLKKNSYPQFNHLYWKLLFF